jgi:hypothetical protein
MRPTYGRCEYPLDSFLEILGVQDVTLKSVDRLNLQPKYGTEELLRLNRMDISESERIRLKRE